MQNDSEDWIFNQFLSWSLKENVCMQCSMSSCWDSLYLRSPMHPPEKGYEFQIDKGRVILGDVWKSSQNPAEKGET